MNKIISVKRLSKTKKQGKYHLMLWNPFKYLFYSPFLILISFLFTIPFMYGQKTITGTIQDETTKQGIPYVSISITGTTTGTLTNQYGDFKIPVNTFSASDTIRISAIGYEDLSIAGSKIELNKPNLFFLKPVIYDLHEVKVKPKKLGYKFLGTNDYSDNTCTSFTHEGDNWLGKQAAILANNKPETTVYIESFGFYIIKNEYEDSLTFRLMLYEINEKGLPGKTFLKKPIIFSTNVKQGEVRIDLKDQNISTSSDFFISLECLEEEMDAKKFCFAGAIKVPSYFKNSVISRWGKVKGGGGAFNLKVSYKKN